MYSRLFSNPIKAMSNAVYGVASSVYGVASYTTTTIAGALLFGAQTAEASANTHTEHYEFGILLGDAKEYSNDVLCFWTDRLVGPFRNETNYAAPEYALDCGAKALDVAIDLYKYCNSTGTPLTIDLANDNYPGNKLFDACPHYDDITTKDFVDGLFTGKVCSVSYHAGQAAQCIQDFADTYNLKTFGSSGDWLITIGGGLLTLAVVGGGLYCASKAGWFSRRSAPQVDNQPVGENSDLLSHEGAINVLRQQ